MELSSTAGETHPSLEGLMRAMDLVEAAERSARADERALALEYYGMALDELLREGMYDMAASTAQRMLDRFPGVVRARGTLAVLSLAESLRKLAHDQIEVSRPEFELYVAAARAAGQEQVAIRHLRSVAEETESSLVRGWLLTFLESLGDYEGAEEVRRGSIALNDDVPGHRALPDQDERWARILQTPANQSNPHEPERVASAAAGRGAAGIPTEILDQIPDGFFTLDLDGRFIYLNRSAEKIFHRLGSDLLGRNIWDVFPETAQGRAFAETGQVHTERLAHHFEQTLRTLDRYFEVQLYPSDGGLSVHLRDITDQRRTSEERQRLLLHEQEIRHRAEQEARLGRETLQILAHDLRNPLHAIRLNIEVAQEVVASGRLPSDELDRILSAVRRTDRLLESLLDANRLEAGERLPIDRSRVHVAPVLREACALFEPHIRQKRLHLDRTVPDDCPEVWADENRLLQVFWNLIGNAVKFSPSAGRISLRADPWGEYVRFSVGDSGPGVAEEARGRLFDPYWQEKRTARLGTGLGLPITKMIVEAHGGQIWLEKGSEEGATFTFTIPSATR